MAQQDPMKKMMNRFLAATGVDQAVEVARAAAAPYVEKGIAQAKTKLTDVAAKALDVLPAEQLAKLAQSGQEAFTEAQSLAGSIQSSALKIADDAQREIEKLASAVKYEAEKLSGNPKLAEFLKDAQAVVAAVRPAAEEAAPEAETETPAAPAAEEAPAAPKKTRKRKPKGPSL